jgi:hypothetical protein
MTLAIILVSGLIGCVLSLVIVSSITEQGIYASIVTFIKGNGVDADLCLKKEFTVWNTTELQNGMEQVIISTTKECVHAIMNQHETIYNFERALDNTYEFWRRRANPISHIFDPIVWFDRYLFGAWAFYFGMHILHAIKQKNKASIKIVLALTVTFNTVLFLMIIAWGGRDPYLWLLTFGYQALGILFAPLAIGLIVWMIYPVLAIASVVILLWIRGFVKIATGMRLRTEYTSFLDELIPVLPALIEITFDETPRVHISDEDEVSD